MPGPPQEVETAMPEPITTPVTTASSTLYFGPWYRRSPFFEKTLEAGCSAYDIYNHMYLPGYYADPVEEYWALLNDVTVWDVAVERIVEITGPDASAFTNMLTCRDLTKCAVGQGKYVLITAEDGGIVNDPVLLRVEADRWWLALADSDAGLWARGVATHAGMDVKVREPDVYPMQIQGPRSKDVMRTLFGPAIDDIKYYWTLTTELDGIPVVISRTGWTGEVGYEIYLRDPSRGGDLRDRVMEAGKPHRIRPIAPCEARRIEAGIFNYGSDITVNDTPFHVMGLERLVETQDADYIGKAALEEIRVNGVDRKLVGIEADGDAYPFELSRKCEALHDGKPVGTVTDLIWSPRLKKNIGYVWLSIDLAAPGTPLEIVAPDGGQWPARSASIPFIDPKKANYGQNIGHTMPVDSYPEGISGFGVYNMAGNVFEWVEDWYDLKYYKNSPALNPRGAEKGYNFANQGPVRVLRGGSWLAPETSLHTSHRFWNQPENNSYGVGLGFRCARSAQTISDEAMQAGRDAFMQALVEMGIEKNADAMASIEKALAADPDNMEYQATRDLIKNAMKKTMKKN